jgi:two-component system, sensor histidine kinase
MKKAPIPANESQRLDDLLSYDILDTPAEVEFDDITRLASWITGKPIALVSLLDQHRQWFKSKHGLGADETPRDVSFCGHAINGTDIFVIPDAHLDPRFADNPLVTGGPNVRFYAGVPLQSPNGFNLGTLCVIDSKEGVMTAEQTEMLQRLARQVVSQMELRKKSSALAVAMADVQLTNDALKISNLAKSNFIANMSHEIRTPLNAIFGTLQILEDKPIGESEKQLLEMAHSASETVMQLINNILDSAKIESGRIDINLEAGLIQSVTQATAEMFKSRALQAKVAIETDFEGDSKALLLFDELRVKQILMNLIGNALKFTPEGGSISIRSKLERSGFGATASWVIKDSGIGMDGETLAKICQPFEQGNARIQQKYGGTGLGLALVKRLLDLLTGKILIESSVGKGTTITVTVPMLAPPEHVKAGESVVNDGALVPCPALIVDDVKANRIVLNHFMSKMKFPVMEADCGLQALKIFREQRPPLVLLDIQMPEMDGYEVIRNIRALEATTPNIPKAFIVAVTGQAFIDEVKKSFETGFDAHISKPVSKVQLHSILVNRPVRNTKG